MLYIIRIILVLSWVAICSFFTLILCLVTPFNPNLPGIIGRILGRPTLKILGIKVIYQNIDKSKNQNPSIIISNHQDNLDIIPIGNMCPKNTVSLGKKSIVWFPIFGLMYWLSGNILIDRSNKKRAFASMEDVSNKIKEKKMNVWIMPEGTRSKGKGLMPFKKGAFYTAVGAQVPIIPVVICSYHLHLDYRRWKTGTIILKVLDPIPTAGIRVENIPEFMENTHSIMKKEIDKIDKELLAMKNNS